MVCCNRIAMDISQFLRLSKFHVVQTNIAEWPSENAAFPSIQRSHSAISWVPCE